MATQINKPYVWLEKSGAYPKIMFRVWSTPGYGIKYNAQLSHEDTLFVLFKMDPTIAPLAEYSFSLDPGGSIYNAAIHEKVTLVILMTDDSTVGFTSIMPGSDTFQIVNPPIGIPYNFLKFIATDNMEVHTTVFADQNYKFKQLAHDDSIPFQRTVRFQMTGTPSGIAINHYLTHLLNSTTHFDPTIERVFVNIVELDPRGVERRKGTGTVHTSEGDASNDE